MSITYQGLFQKELNEFGWDVASMALPVTDIYRGAKGLYQAYENHSLFSYEGVNAAVRLGFGITATIPQLALFSKAGSAIFRNQHAVKIGLKLVEELPRAQQLLYKFGQVQRFLLLPFVAGQVLNTFTLLNAGLFHCTSSDVDERHVGYLRVAQCMLFGVAGAAYVGGHFWGAYNKAATIQRLDTASALRDNKGSQMDFLKTLNWYLAPGHNREIKIKNPDIVSFTYDAAWNSAKITFVEPNNPKLPPYREGEPFDNHFGNGALVQGLSYLFDYMSQAILSIARRDQMLYNEIVLQWGSRELRNVAEKLSHTLIGMQTLIRTKADGTRYIPNHLEAALKHETLADFIAHKMNSAMVRIPEVAHGLDDIFVIKPALRVVLYPLELAGRLVCKSKDRGEMMEDLVASLTLPTPIAALPGTQTVMNALLKTPKVIRSYVEGHRAYKEAVVEYIANPLSPWRTSDKLKGVNPLLQTLLRKIFFKKHVITDKTIEPRILYDHTPGIYDHGLTLPQQTPALGDMPIMVSSMHDTSMPNLVFTLHGEVVPKPTADEIPSLLAGATSGHRTLLGKLKEKRPYSSDQGTNDTHAENVVAWMEKMRHWMQDTLTGEGQYFREVSEGLVPRKGHSGVIRG